MEKKEKEHAPAKTRAPHPTDVTGCVICGQYTGELSESAGLARWHKACGTARPDLVAKAKARA